MPTAQSGGAPSRPDLAFEEMAVKVERRSLGLMFGMKMWRGMIAEIHSDGNAEKRRYLRHPFTRQSQLRRQAHPSRRTIDRLAVYSANSKSNGVANQDVGRRDQLRRHESHFQVPRAYSARSQSCNIEPARRLASSRSTTRSVSDSSSSQLAERNSEGVLGMRATRTAT
jgi:hypothetical protein